MSICVVLRPLSILCEFYDFLTRFYVLFLYNMMHLKDIGDNWWQFTLTDAVSFTFWWISESWIWRWWISNKKQRVLHQIHKKTVFKFKSIILFIPVNKNCHFYDHVISLTFALFNPSSALQLIGYFILFPKKITKIIFIRQKHVNIDTILQLFTFL